MFSHLSLKYRIAIVIFILEAIMMTAVLWNTTQQSLAASNQHQSNNHGIIITLLGELSNTALLTEEYGDIQLYFEQMQSQAGINAILLTDIDQKIVASSHVEDIGLILPALNNTAVSFWRNQVIESEAGDLGTIWLQFTNKNLLHINKAIRTKGITLAAIGMIIILSISLLVGFALTRRLERISLAAKQFSEGDVNAQSKVDGSDELGKLGLIFDRMVVNVGNKQRELEKHQNQLEILVEKRTKTTHEQAQIIDQIHDSIILTNLHGIIKSWNNGAQRLFGYEASEAIGKHIRFLYPASEHTPLNDRITELKNKGSYESEIEMFRKNGEVFFGHLSLTLQFDSRNKIIGMISYSMDISQRKNAENELIKRSKQLEVSNKELEAFSYSVSHDLRSPLRAINGFCGALMDDFQHKLDGEALDLLLRVKNNSIRMGRLIDDLLNLSKIGRQEMKKNNANFSNMVQIIANQLQEEYTHQVDILIQENVTCDCDENLMEIVLFNLLDNAWKYSSKKSHAKVEFGSKYMNNRMVYFVKDDGAGFDADYSNKLFGAFQRLHKTNEFEGTGIGLATVLRIIHRHNGKIWAESVINEGATFYFEFQ